MRRARDTIQLDHHGAFDHEICHEPTDSLTTVSYDYRNLSLDGQASLLQPNDHAILVNRFEKAVAELMEHIVERADDGLGQVLAEHLFGR